MQGSHQRDGVIASTMVTKQVHTCAPTKFVKYFDYAKLLWMQVVMPAHHDYYKICASIQINTSLFSLMLEPCTSTTVGEWQWWEPSVSGTMLQSLTKQWLQSSKGQTTGEEFTMATTMWLKLTIFKRLCGLSSTYSAHANKTKMLCNVCYIMFTLSDQEK